MYSFVSAFIGIVKLLDIERYFSNYSLCQSLLLCHKLCTHGFGDILLGALRHHHASV